LRFLAEFFPSPVRQPAALEGGVLKKGAGGGHSTHYEMLNAVDAMLKAKREEANDPEYREELAVWDATLSDGDRVRA
jgi:hypothetical protein